MVASNGQLKESAGSTIPDEFVVWRTQSNLPSTRYAKRLSEATIDVKTGREENEATARLNAVRARGLSGAAKTDTLATEKSVEVTRTSKVITTAEDGAQVADRAPAHKDRRQAVFDRLHEDQHRLSVKIEQQQRKIVEEERENFFRPRINADRKALRRCLNGRRRQSADVYCRSLLEIKRCSQ